MPTYDAFISYSHAKDKPIAAALQSVIQRLGKAWHQRRAARVFRDDTSLSATPHLWPSIERALSGSSHLILLASPEAASSPWIGKEVEYWLEHKSFDTLFIGLTAGELAWDDKKGDFEWSAATPLPKALRGRFASEPKWVDLKTCRDGADPHEAKFIDLGADFAAAIRGIPKEDLMSEELRQERRTRRLAVGVAASLLVLAGAAAWQWSEADAERTHAEAEALRAEQQSKLAQDNEQLAKQQQTLAEDRAFDARLRAQAAESRVLQATDPHAALKLSAETLDENLKSGRALLPEVYASTFDALKIARKQRVIETRILRWLQRNFFAVGRARWRPHRRRYRRYDPPAGQRRSSDRSSDPCPRRTFHLYQSTCLGRVRGAPCRCQRARSRQGGEQRGTANLRPQRSTGPHPSRSP